MSTKINTSRRFFEAFVKAASKHAARLLKEWQSEPTRVRKATRGRT